ncbi:MAG: excinuclease ABC, partial [Bacteroidales bacterium]|nr:excinuclease ABC [Bacteroidales bacterium]
HKLLIININKTYKQKKKQKNGIYDRPNIYEATRGWWVLDPQKAKQVDFVLSEYKGIVRTIFKPEKWLQNVQERGDKRWGFEGNAVTDEKILAIYLNKEIIKQKGQANPIRYSFPLFKN